MYSWVSVAVLASLCIIAISVRFLAGWLRNLGIWSGGCINLAAAIGAIGQSTLFQNLQNVEIAIMLLAVGLIAGPFIVRPCIDEKEAENRALTFAREKNPNVPFNVTKVELDNWTWYVSGPCAVVGQFWVKVHAKTGKVRASYFS